MGFHGIGAQRPLQRFPQTGDLGALRHLAANGRHPRDWPVVPVPIAGLDRRIGDGLSLEPTGGHLMVTPTLRVALSKVLQASLPAVAATSVAAP